MDTRTNTLSIDNCEQLLDVIQFDKSLEKHSALGKSVSINNSIIKGYQNVHYRTKQFNLRYVHFFNKSHNYLHFITISTDLLYFHQRYFNHYNTTRLSYCKRFFKILKKHCVGIPTNITFEESKRAGKFIHAHLIVYCKKVLLHKLVNELKDSFTNEHYLTTGGKQSAVKVSEKNYSTIEKAITYFLGRNYDGSWKQEFYCYSTNFILKDLSVAQTISLKNPNKCVVHL